MTVSCGGRRQAARARGVARSTVEHRFAWLAAVAGAFQAHRLVGSGREGRFQLDELQTLEGSRCQPVSVPVPIDRTTSSVAAADGAPHR